MESMRTRTAIGLLLLAVLASWSASGQSAKRIYIANDCHTDYMWSADEEGYKRAFLRMLDYYLELADSTDKDAPDFQSRFACDGTFWFRVFERNRTQSEVGRLVKRIKDGHITLPLTLLNLCYGGMPAEAVLRSMYYAGRLERRYGFRLDLALAQENQTLPYGLGALWAGAGARYSWKGICGCASRTENAGDRINDIYWWPGPDGSRLLMKWNSMLRGSYDPGGYAEARDIPGVIDDTDTGAAFRARYPYGTIGIFGYGGDDLTVLTDKFAAVAKQASTANRRVVVSNESDFFKDFEAAWGGAIPSQSWAFGNEWDILSASMAEVSARVKRGVESLRAAEALASLVTLRDALFMPPREAAREQAWIDLGLYYEHDWTADGPVSREARAAWERAQADGFTGYVDALRNDAAAALGGMIARSGANPRFFVFNALGWTRTDAADFPFDGAGPVRVLDLAAGREACSQIVTLDGRPHLRILAEGVPAVGYKVYEVASGAPAARAGGPQASGAVIENAAVRITLSPNGAVSSWIDKARGGREMVRAVGGLRANDLGPGTGTLAVENAGPVSATLTATAAGPLAHTTSVTLVRDSPRVEIRNVIGQNFSDVRTWSFGFAFDAPEVRHEEIGAVITAAPAAKGGAYAPRGARVDWLTLNHFADVGQGALGVTLSSPDCAFMRLGASTPSVLDTATPQINVLAGGQVDGSSLGIPGQGGDASFLQRFGLRVRDAFDPADDLRFSLEHQNPFVTGAVTGGALYPETSYSLLAVEEPGLLLWSIKPAEDSAAGGLVARLWNASGAAVPFELAFTDFPVLEARRATHLETPLEVENLSGGALAAAAGAREWVTYLLKLDASKGPGKGIGRKAIR
jgi:alpha-mannosidase